MSIEDIIKKFRLMRVNPFQGLVIDADTWRDAHNYHRDLQRLHLLAFHQEGIIGGLGVSAGNPADLTVNIDPGLAVDPDGNIIVVPQAQRYKVHSAKAGTVYLILQFREVPEGPYQPPDGGQPTRLVDAYRIEERDVLPVGAYIELARIDFDPADQTIRNARTPSRAAKNEINLAYRREAATTAAPAAAPAVTPKEPVAERPAAAPTPAVSVPSRPEIVIGHAVLGDAPADLHLAGARNLAAYLNNGGVGATLVEKVPLEKDLKRFHLLYLAGNSRFEITAEQQASLENFLKTGGTVFGEGCAEGVKEFGLAFNQLAGRLQRKLEVVPRGHALLSQPNLFAMIPEGTENPMLLEGGHMVYSGSDYGCAWQGGRNNETLPRETIRSALEIGANIAEYARTGKTGS